MYLVMEIQRTAEDEVTYLVNAYKTVSEAENKYHTILAYAAISEVPTHTAIILTPEGYVQKAEHYTHEQLVVDEVEVEQEV